MYVLPLKGDAILTTDGTEYTFLEYAGDRVLWVSESNADPVKVSMELVKQINKSPVTIKGKSCFITALPLGSRANLPQKKDELTMGETTWDVVEVNLDPVLSVKVKEGVNTNTFKLKDFKNQADLDRTLNTYWQYL